MIDYERWILVCGLIVGIPALLFWTSWQKREQLKDSLDKRKRKNDE